VSNRLLAAMRRSGATVIVGGDLAATTPPADHQQPPSCLVCPTTKGAPTAALHPGGEAQRVDDAGSIIA
jgi:hypothetical protein